METSVRTAFSCNKAVNPYNDSCLMGEGSEFKGGGTPNVSNTFADSFYYLYQLAQVLIGGNTGTIPSKMKLDGSFWVVSEMMRTQLKQL